MIWRESDYAGHTTHSSFLVYVHVAAVCKHATFVSDWAYVIKIFSFSSNFRYSLVDFVSKGVRKAFQYTFENG